MTHPGGYPGQGPQQQPGPGYGAPQQTSVNLPILLSLGITLLGLVSYFCSFSGEANAGIPIIFLLVGGLLAAFRALPNAPTFLPVAAVLSAAGALLLLSDVVSAPEGSETPGIVVVMLIMGILQMLVAVAALLLEFGVLKVPAPSQPQFGGYPPSGQFPAQQQPGPYGQTQQYPQQPGQYPQQPGHPGTPPGGYPQQG
jgi:hypothetical protein